MFSWTCTCSAAVPQIGRLVPKGTGFVGFQNTVQLHLQIFWSCICVFQSFVYIYQRSGRIMEAVSTNMCHFFWRVPYIANNTWCGWSNIQSERLLATGAKTLAWTGRDGTSVQSHETIQLLQVTLVGIIKSHSQTSFLGMGTMYTSTFNHTFRSLVLQLLDWVLAFIDVLVCVTELENHASWPVNNRS